MIRDCLSFVEKLEPMKNQKPGEFLNNSNGKFLELYVSEWEGPLQEKCEQTKQLIATITEGILNEKSHTEQLWKLLSSNSSTGKI